MRHSAAAEAFSDALGLVGAGSPVGRGCVSVGRGCFSIGVGCLEALGLAFALLLLLFLGPGICVLWMVVVMTVLGAGGVQDSR